MSEGAGQTAVAGWGGARKLAAADVSDVVGQTGGCGASFLGGGGRRERAGQRPRRPTPSRPTPPSPILSQRGRRDRVQGGGRPLRAHGRGRRGSCTRLSSADGTPSFYEPEVPTVTTSPGTRGRRWRRRRGAGTRRSWAAETRGRARSNDPSGMARGAAAGRASAQRGRGRRRSQRSGSSAALGSPKLSQTPRAPLPARPGPPLQTRCDSSPERPPPPPGPPPLPFRCKRTATEARLAGPPETSPAAAPPSSPDSAEASTGLFHP